MKKVLFFIFISLAGLVNAQTKYGWEQLTNSVGSGFYNSFVVLNNKIFIGSDVDVFCSADSGKTWTGTGLTNKTVQSLSSFSNNLIAGTYLGVYISPDYGQTWNSADTGIKKPTTVNCFAYDGVNLYAATTNGFYSSNNNGKSWNHNTNLGFTTNYDIDIHSVYCFDNKVFIGPTGNSQGVYVSSDQGNTWSSANFGLPDGEVWVFFSNGSNLYIGGDGTLGIYVSNDDGNSWSPLNNGLCSSLDIRSFALSGSNFYCANAIGCGNNSGGVSLSTNNGNNWTDISKNLPSDYARSVITFGKYVYVALSFNGIWSYPHIIAKANDLTNVTTGIIIYPNPANDNITIEKSSLNNIKDEVISIYNIQGQLLIQQPMLQTKTNIDISTLAKGMYFMEVKTEKRVELKKFVKE